MNRLYPGKVTGIGGHRAGAFLHYEDIIKQPLFYFTFLRDPIKRYLSHLNWQKMIMLKGWTFDSFASDAYYNDFQCYRIAGIRNFEAAKKILNEKFAMAGILERYTESLLMLKHLLQKPLDIRSGKSNEKVYETKDQIEWEGLTVSQQEKLKENNKEDLKLYEYAIACFEEQLKSIPNLAQQKEQYIQNNKGYKFSSGAQLKRKMSNNLLSKVIQPTVALITRQHEKGR